MRNLIKKILKESIIDDFERTGEIPDGTYYFDPPLIEPEIRFLYERLKSLKNSDKILWPLTSRHENKNLLWLDISRYTIYGWQNVDTDEDEYGQYLLHDYESVKRWCKNSGDCHKLIDGRKNLGIDYATPTDDEISDIFKNLAS